jgi:ABC-type sugar transport system ATPase subunit
MFIGRGNYKFVHWSKMREQTTELLEKLSIPARATQQLATCSLAVQQMVAIARAVGHGLQGADSVTSRRLRSTSARWKSSFR